MCITKMLLNGSRLTGVNGRRLQPLLQIISAHHGPQLELVAHAHCFCEARCPSFVKSVVIVVVIYSSRSLQLAMSHSPEPQDPVFLPAQQE